MFRRDLMDDKELKPATAEERERMRESAARHVAAAERARAEDRLVVCGGLLYGPSGRCLGYIFAESAPGAAAEMEQEIESGEEAKRLVGTLLASEEPPEGLLSALPLFDGTAAEHAAAAWRWFREQLGAELERS